MTAVDIQVDGAWRFDIQDWSVVSDSTPLTAGDMTGGAGTLSFGLPEGEDVLILQGRPVLLRNPEMGDTSGKLGLGSGNGANVTLTGFSDVNNLNVTVTAEPFSGTLRGYIIYLLGLCGVTDTPLVETGIASRPVTYIGWEGNALDRLKDLCSAHHIELALVGTRTVFRPALARVISERSFADWTWQTDEGALARNVEVNWYDTGELKNQILYPAGGWTDDVQILSVNAKETVEVEISLSPEQALDAGPQIGASVASILQPVCVERVDRNYAGTQSVYSIAGKDGLPLSPAQWTDNGGSLTVEVLEGGSKLKVTLTGSSEEEYAPYQVAMASGTSDTYSSLRLYGNGVIYRRNTVTMGTGLDEKRAPQETAPAVASPFISTHEEAWRAAAGLLAAHSGARMTIQGTLLKTINAKLPATSHTWFGTTDTVDENPETHPYGNLEGAIFYAMNKAFRIRTVTYTPTATSFTAEQHLTDGLAEEPLGTLTAAQFNARYPAGITAGQLNAIHLRGYDL